MERESFTDYETLGEVGVDLDKVIDTLKLSKPDDDVNITMKDNKLVFKINNLRRSMGTLDTYGISTPKIPSLSLPNTIKIDTEPLRTIVKASKDVSDYLVITCNEDDITISSEGDTDDVSLKITKDDVLEYKFENSTRSLYSLDYFGNMIRSVNTDNVSFDIGTDYPIQLNFNIPDYNIKGSYLIAPRIEGE